MLKACSEVLYNLLERKPHFPFAEGGRVGVTSNGSPFTSIPSGVCAATALWWWGLFLARVAYRRNSNCAGTHGSMRDRRERCNAATGSVGSGCRKR